MARGILNIKPDSKYGLKNHNQTKTGLLINPAAIELKLRQKRSPEYRRSVISLDAGSYHRHQDIIDAFIESLRKEFPEIPERFWPLGLAARCHLGEPYEVHIIALAGNIIDHYKIGQSMPANFECVRSLALHPAYEFIEVYEDKSIAVLSDGSSSIIRR